MSNEDIKIPKYVDDAFENTNDLLCDFSEYALEKLGYPEDKKMENTFISELGITMNMKNRDGNGFSVLITDTDDMNVFRRRIVWMAEGIKENFPEVLKTH